MRLRRPPGPETLNVRPIADEEELVAYRIILTDDREHPDFERSFMSRARLGLPPRPGTPEERHPELAEGISMFRRREAATETARRYTSLGRFTAEVVLRGGAGTRIAEWGRTPGHLTIWGDSLTLCRAAADIQPVFCSKEVPEDDVPDPRRHG